MGHKDARQKKTSFARLQLVHTIEKLDFALSVRIFRVKQQKLGQ